MSNNKKQADLKRFEKLAKPRDNRFGSGYVKRPGKISFYSKGDLVFEVDTSKAVVDLAQNPCPGFQPNTMPQIIPILNWQVGWIEPVYKDTTCAYCGSKIVYSRGTGNCWTRVLGTNAIVCKATCAVKMYFGEEDALAKILFELLLLATKPTEEQKKVFSQI